MRTLTIVTFSILLLPLTFSQDFVWQPLTRELEISQGDSTVRFRILINQENITPDKSNFYFWNNKGQINMNQGNFAGELLHGDFLVFNKSGNLITKGQLNYGLFDGKWMQWHNNGRLKKVLNYSNGKLNGSVFRYNEKGFLKEELVFKKGMLVVKEDKTFKVFNHSRPDTTTVEQVKKVENTGTESPNIEKKEKKRTNIRKNRTENPETSTNKQ